MKSVTALILLLLISSCSSHKKPDLERLYCHPNDNCLTPGSPIPLILLHGFRGSKLRDKITHREIWYGDMQKVLFSNYHDLSLQINPDSLSTEESMLEPYEIIDKAGNSDFYRDLIHALQTYGKYQYTEAGTSVTDSHRHVYLFNYDWRLDNVVNAMKLHDFIQQIKKDYRQPGLKVDLVAHSMGGLISRYYLRYGNNDIPDDGKIIPDFSGAKNIRKVIIMGTPNLGSATALESFVNGLKVGLRHIPTDILATMPSVYQLIPHNTDDWLIDINGNTLNADLYDVDTWKKLHWSVYNPKTRRQILNRFQSIEEGEKYLKTLERYFQKQLKRAHQFAQVLTVPVTNPPYRIIVMGGDCQHTPARLLVENINGDIAIRLQPEEINSPLSGINYEDLLMKPGDGSVTKDSLLGTVSNQGFLPLDFSYFICEKHETLPSNIHLEDNLLHILLND